MLNGAAHVSSCNRQGMELPSWLVNHTRVKLLDCRHITVAPLHSSWLYRAHIAHVSSTATEVLATN